MKKIIALLLVLCLVFGLVACGKKTTGDNNVADTGSSNSGSNDSGDSGNNDAGNNDSGNTNTGDKPYAGKTLQIWGLVGDEYQSIDKINAKVWLWMVCAAIEEWAAINDVKLEYVAPYNQDSLIGSINSGEKPDFCMATQAFPAVANMGLIQPFNDEQKAKISDIVGESWLQMYRGEAYGVLPPWTGAETVKYNRSMMERYDVKTPQEYIDEGNWTWETFMKVARECTKDIDGDGKLDTIGATVESMQRFVQAVNEDPETGKLTSNMNSEVNKAFADMIYKGVVEEKSILAEYRVVTDMKNPQIAMSIQDGEAYNFAHNYKVLTNGDIIETCMPPAQNKDSNVRLSLTNYNFFIPTGSDDADAATDMICYILKAGMKWIEDHSEGLYDTEYKGITGACKYSKAWKELYDDFLWERDDEYAKIKDDYNEEAYAQLLEDYLTVPKNPGRKYSNVSTSPYTAKEMFEAPPATSLATLGPRLESQCAKYNELFLS